MKIYVASFNRASDGVISKLIRKMKDKRIHTDDYEESDYILAVGDRIETFDFVLCRFREDMKIIHLWAGESGTISLDEVYRHSISLMSCIQLCTNEQSKKVVDNLFESIGRKSNSYIIGNLSLDNLEIKDKPILKPYDLVLYNPSINKKDTIKDVQYIKRILLDNYIWLPPNGDDGSDVIKLYSNYPNLPRPEFLGLLKNCNRFISNSSCIYYEAPFLLDKDKIVIIGNRNANRESGNSDMTIKNASDNAMKIFNTLDKE